MNDNFMYEDVVPSYEDVADLILAVREQPLEFDYNETQIWKRAEQLELDKLNLKATVVLLWRNQQGAEMSEV